MSEGYFSAQTTPGAVSQDSAPVWELSGWWRRVGALIVDLVIIWVPLSILAGLVGLRDSGFQWVFAFAASSAYYMLTMSAWQGQTVGKRIAGIRVVREDGKPVDMTFAFVRQIIIIMILFNTLGAVLLLIPSLLNYLWPLWDDKHQALHDKIAHSRVVRAEKVSDPGFLQAAQQQEQAQVQSPASPPGFENPVPDDD